MRKIMAQCEGAERGLFHIHLIFKLTFAYTNSLKLEAAVE